MYETLNSLELNVIINVILLIFGCIYSAMTFQDYQREKNKQNLLFFSFEVCGTMYLFLYIIELLTTTLGASELFLFALAFIRVFFAVIMYTSAGDYIVLQIEKTHPIAKPVKNIIHLGLVLLFFTMPFIYSLSHSSLLTNIPIFIYLLLLEAVVLKHRQALATKNTIIYTLLIIPTLFLTVQKYWNYTPPNIYVTVLMVIIHCEIQQKQRITMLEIEKQIIKHKNEVVHAKVSLLSSQINPHFLFNTLSSIAKLCEKDGKTAKYLTLEFASYMRNIAEDLDNLNPIPFAKELSHTEHYLNIEKLRFGNKLRIDFDIAEMDFKVPPLTLQPLVENSIKHGIMPKDGGLVVVETYADEEAYYIRVMDDGVGFESNTTNENQKHLGIKNIAKRLEYMCGGELTISSEKAKGTLAIIKLPKERLQ